MVSKLIESIKGILFVDPKLTFEEEKNLINQPFYFRGTNGKGIILVHGWTSTPYEVRRLGKYLNEKGFTVFGPLLRGHGTKPENLENITWHEWLEDLSIALNEIKKDCGQIYIGGTSIGANLAMLLAAERPEINGLVLMAAPYRINFERILEVFGKILLPFKKYNNKYYPPTFGASTTITRIISYQKYSIKSALEVLELIRISRKKLSQITQPVFIIQSKHDHIVSRNSLEKIYTGINSKIKKKKYLEKAYHTFISDIKNEHVFENIAEFIEEN